MKKQIAFSLLTVKAVKDDARVITGMATTPTPDRVGDVVEPLGVTFKNPLPLLWQHYHDKPVGTVVFGAPTSKGIPFTATLPEVDEPGALKDRVDEAWQSVKLGLVRAVSIGFRAMEYSFIDDGGVRFVSTEVFELSLVTIPANAEATIDSVKSIVKGYDLAASGAKLLTAKTGVTVKTNPREPKAGNAQRTENTLTIAEQIAAFIATKALKEKRLVAIVEDNAAETLSVELQEEFDAIEAELKELDGHVARLQKVEKMLAASAKAVPQTPGAAAASAARGGVAAVAKNTQILDKGMEFAQFAICLAMGKGNLQQAEKIAENRFASNEAINTAIKAAVNAGTTTDSTWAAPLVDTYQRFAGDFIEFLRPQTVIGQFGVGNVPSLRRVPFNISISGQTSGGAGYWVGEGKAKPLTKFDFANVNLGWAKVANIAVLTEELIRFSNPSAEALVRQSLADALIARLDTDFLDPAKAVAAGVSPASITNGVTQIASSGTDAAAVRYDIQRLFTAYITANMTPTAGVWIMSSVNALALSLMTNALGQKEFPGITMLGGTLEGLPVIVSEYTPAGLVILANASDIYLADDGQVMLDASREASLQMDSAPTMTSNPASAIETVSMFQTNSVALRAERWINWQKRRAQAVQVLSGVAWGTVSGS